METTKSDDTPTDAGILPVLGPMHTLFIGMFSGFILGWVCATLLWRFAL